MLISLDKNLVILAMTKTGSTALHAALGPHCDIIYRGPPRVKHMNLMRFERFLRPYLSAIGHDEIETFGLIREPEDWLRSWYRYRARPELDEKPNSTAHLSFDAFVEAYLSETPPPFAQVGRPSKFYAPPTDGAPVTHVFRYDAMDAATSFLEERFGRKLTLKRMNLSPPKEAELNPALRQRLLHSLSKDYTLYKKARTNT